MANLPKHLQCISREGCNTPVTCQEAGCCQRLNRPTPVSSKEYLLQAIETALEAMRDCQRNAHGGKVCFDGDEWHERWATLSEARRG